MATSDFLTFAGAVGSNVISQSAYATLTAQQTGFQSGVANSAQLNKVWRQSSIMSAVLAQFIVDRTGQNVVDDGTITNILANLKLAAAALNGDSSQTFSVAPATVGTQAPQLAQVQSGASKFAVDTGSANAYVVNPSPAITGLAEGMLIGFRAANTNTGASTINVGGQGVMSLRGSAGALLKGGEIVQNGYYVAMYDAFAGVWSIVGSYLGATQIGSASQPDHAVQLQQIGHGQCRLSVVSTTQLKVAPYGGLNVLVNGVPLQLPAAGITASNSGLSASTLYYVYLSGTTAAPVLNLSTTGHVTGSNGVEVKSGDATQTLVGMIRTNASSQFVDSQTQRFCLNWFNRRSLSGNQGFAANRSTTSTTPVEISSSERMEFLCWADEAVYLSSPVSLSQNTSGSIATYLYVDGTSAAGNALSPPSGQIVFASPHVAQPLSEGYHYASVYGVAVSGFTTTWQLSSTVMTMQTRG